MRPSRGRPDLDDVVQFRDQRRRCYCNHVNFSPKVNDRESPVETSTRESLILLYPRKLPHAASATFRKALTSDPSSFPSIPHRTL
jgi:hypothetical protein